MTTIGTGSFDIAAFQRKGINVSLKEIPEETIEFFRQKAEESRAGATGTAGSAGSNVPAGSSSRSADLEKFKQAVKDYTEPTPEEEEELLRARAYDAENVNRGAKTRFEAQVQAGAVAVAAELKA